MIEKDQIIQIIDRLTTKLMSDVKLNYFFMSTDIKSFKEGLSSYILHSLDSRAQYHGQPIRLIHRKFVLLHNMDESHFNMLTGHLMRSMVELKIESDHRKMIMMVFTKSKSDVLNI